MEKIIKYYCGEEQRELKRLVYPMMIQFAGISQKDYDDFYSLAALTLWQATKTYDASKGVSFECYLKGCLSNKLYSMFKKKNALKRTCDRIAESLDVKVGNEGMRISEVIASDFNLEEYVFGHAENLDEIKIEKFLCGLSAVQGKIIELKMEGMASYEIEKQLKITHNQYETDMNIIKEGYIKVFL